VPGRVGAATLRRRDQRPSEYPDPPVIFGCDPAFLRSRRRNGVALALKAGPSCQVVAQAGPGRLHRRVELLLNFFTRS
jgi:hypothetical protein